MKSFVFRSFPKAMLVTAGVTLMAFQPNSVVSAPFSMGNLVVVQAGDGSASLNANATAAFLKEFTVSGSLVQTLGLPGTAAGLNQAFALSGSATSEGFIKLSTDGQYLTLAGYAATAGTVGVATAAPTSVARVVARVDMFGNIDTTTVLGDAYSGSNIRSAISTDGYNIWTGGNGGSGLGASAGVRYTTLGSTTSVRVDSTASNMRVVNIHNGQLYVASATGALLGVSTVGSGLPTSATSSPITLLPGLPTTGSHSSYDFWFKDDSTLYIADDGSAANGGGIQKWVELGGAWSLAYTLLNTGTTTTGVRGLTGTLDENGNALLFGTTAGTSANNLIALLDLGAGSTATTLATAGANTVFRGVEFLPTAVPEPTAAALLILGGLLFARRQQV